VVQFPSEILIWLYLHRQKCLSVTKPTTVLFHMFHQVPSNYLTGPNHVQSVVLFFYVFFLFFLSVRYKEMLIIGPLGLERPERLLSVKWVVV
jgi:hypothetical protein